MKKLFGIAAVLLAATMALLLCGAAAQNEEPETEPEEQVYCTMEEPAKHDYTNLRGTRYRNLYATRYPNLVETLTAKEPEAVTENGTAVSGNAGGGSTGGGQVGVGSASNPGYSGSVGSYSLSDKTVAAHLSVQGTNVQNMAIWQAEGNTNYYTSGHGAVAWAAGSAHLRSGELSQNTVIYGHNWNNCFVPFKKTGPEFESLMAYSYEDFVAENQYIYLTTNSGVHTFQVFAVCFTKDLGFYINCNGISVSSVASTAKGMSLFDFGVSVSDSDKIITLSTCTRYYKGLGANQRFIIMGKLIS